MNASNKTLIDVIIPLYNEAESLPILLGSLSKFEEETYAVFENLKLNFIFVDNASTDGSVEIILRRAGKVQNIEVISHSYNLGLQRSIISGLRHSKGNATIVYQSDMQDPLEVVAKLIESWGKNNLFVATKIRHRNSSGFDSLLRKIGYLTLRGFFGQKMVFNGTDFWLIDKSIREVALIRTNKKTFLRSLLSEIRRPDLVIEYDRKKRLSGSSKYSFYPKYEFFIDAAIFDLRKIGLLYLTFLNFLFSLVVLVILLHQFELLNTQTLVFSLILIAMIVSPFIIFFFVILFEVISRLYRDTDVSDNVITFHLDMENFKRVSCLELGCTIF